MNKVDVVYTVAHRSKARDDWELRYSLRSLAAQEWVRDVYLIGHKPVWARCAHIPCGDPYTPKDANIIAKILTACAIGEISEQFVVNSDDHYVLRPIALAELGPWLDDPPGLEWYRERVRQSLWCRRLISTLAWCAAHSLPQWVFESHIPYVVDKAVYPEVMRIAPWDQGNGLVTHVYYNVALAEQPQPCAGRAMAIRAPYRDLARLSHAAAGKTFLNHNDTGLDIALRGYLERLFPDPSPWEA